MMKRTVPGYGPTTPTIVALGEAPGDEEERQGKPFVGPSGRMLRSAIHNAGLDPDAIRYENTLEYKVRPESLDPSELLGAFSDARTRIAALKPKLVLAIGDTALQATTGKSGITRHHCMPSIGIGEIEGIPVMPLLHPAYILRSMEDAPWLSFGCRKAARILSNGPAESHRSLITSPTVEAALLFIERAMDTPAAIDLEVFHGEITCFAIALSPNESMSIPLATAGASYFSEDDERRIWLALSRLTREAKLLIFQNYIFDALYLFYFGCPVEAPIEDTMIRASVIHPELPKGLADLARLYTTNPQWKADHDWSATVAADALWTYNATDAAVTMEVYHAQEEALQRSGLDSFYTKHTRPLYRPVLSMCQRGFRVDSEALSQVKEASREKVSSLEREIQEAARPYLPETGEPFNPRSHTQVKALLRSLGIPVPSKDGRETSNRTALLKIATSKSGSGIPVLGKLVEFSEVQKVHSTYAALRTDDDGRCRFSVNIGGTKSARFSSSQTPWETGLNSQNIPREFRHIVVPEPDHVFLQLDLKQADARIVAWLAREESMSQIFESGADIHTRVASLIFGREIIGDPDYKRLRYLGKKCVHAFNYGMAERTFIDSCIRDGGLSLSMDEAKRLRTAYFRAFPAVEAWQKSIRDEIRRSRTLVTPFGRRRQFHGHLSDELFREAYAFIPPATVADYLNLGWIAFSRTGDGARVVQQGHDSILVECGVEAVADTAGRLRAAFDGLSFPVYGRMRVIPYDLQIGDNWRDMKEMP